MPWFLTICQSPRNCVFITFRLIPLPHTHFSDLIAYILIIYWPSVNSTLLPIAAIPPYCLPLPIPIAIMPITAYSISHRSRVTIAMLLSIWCVVWVGLWYPLSEGTWICGIHLYFIIFYYLPYIYIYIIYLSISKFLIWCSQFQYYHILYYYVFLLYSILYATQITGFNQELQHL